MMVVVRFIVLQIIVGVCHNESGAIKCQLLAFQLPATEMFLYDDGGVDMLKSLHGCGLVVFCLTDWKCCL